GPTVLALAVPDKLVDVAVPARALVHEDVLELDQPRHVDPDLEVRPPGELSDLPAREEKVAAVDATSVAQLRHHLVEDAQEDARLRLEIVEERPEDLAHEGARELDVVERDLEVLLRLAVDVHRQDRPLKLVHERDRLDERQVLLVIAPGPRLIGDESEVV